MRYTKLCKLGKDFFLVKTSDSAYAAPLNMCEESARSRAATTSSVEPDATTVYYVIISVDSRYYVYRTASDPLFVPPATRPRG